jgi:hypothetical protein
MENKSLSLLQPEPILGTNVSVSYVFMEMKHSISGHIYFGQTQQESFWSKGFEEQVDEQRVHFEFCQTSGDYFTDMKYFVTKITKYVNKTNLLVLLLEHIYFHILQSHFCIYCHKHIFLFLFCSLHHDFVGILHYIESVVGRLTNNELERIYGQTFVA